MSERKYLYETTFIANATLEDHQVDAIVARTQDIITKEGGETKAVNRWGRKRLAYPIKKKNNGFYVNVEYEAPGSVVKQLGHVFSLDEHILRFLTVRVDPKALKARALAVPQPVAEEIPIPANIPVEAVEKAPLFDDDDEVVLP